MSTATFVRVWLLRKLTVVVELVPGNMVADNCGTDQVMVGWSACGFGSGEGGSGASECATGPGLGTGSGAGRGLAYIANIPEPTTRTRATVRRMLFIRSLNAERVGWLPTGRT